MFRHYTLAIACLFLLLFAALLLEINFGSTNYTVNRVNYRVPHKYEFLRNFSLPWLDEAKGLDTEPSDSIWLLLPADELARDVPGYSRFFHGYSTDVPADVVVNILGGKEALEFPDDHKQLDEKIRQFEREGARREADHTGWERVIWVDGRKGTPGEGHLNFYLIATSKKPMPSNWLPPSCSASPDINNHETYDCHFTIAQNGHTFDFTLRQENLALASRIPAYVMRRLNEWRR